MEMQIPTLEQNTEEKGDKGGKDSVDDALGNK